MKTPFQMNAIGTIVLLTVALAVPAWAADDEALEQLLMKKGVITQEEWEAIQAQEAAASQPDVAAGPEEEKEEVKVVTKADHKGIRFETTDGKFKFAFGGRLQFDAAGYIEDVSDMGNGIEVRRARIKSYGTLFHDWDYKLEVNFDTDLEVPLTDAWLRYSRFKPFTITIGHQKVPFSQQSMTSSNWQVFQERGLPDAFVDNKVNGRRRLGGVVGGYGDQLVHWTFNVGVFGEGIAFDKTGNEDIGTAARLTLAPFAEDRKLLAVGGSFMYRKILGVSELSYASKPESHIANTAMVNTTEILSNEGVLTWNVEGTAAFGPLHAQGEYSRVHVDRNNFPGTFVPAPTLIFDGWYVQAGWFITGESRNYDWKSAKFKRPNPKRPLLGAWEIAARFSRIDLDDKDVFGGKEQNVTAGINWWANRNVVLRFNYVYAEVEPRTAEDAIGDALLPVRIQENVHAFMGRAQIVF